VEGACDGSSGEHVSRLEWHVLKLALTVDSAHELANVPGPVLLKNALACNAECIAQGIQTGFRGVGLPAPIIDRHVVVGDGGDQVPVKVDRRRSRFGVELNRGVSVSPVAVALDCLAHLGFDFAHLSRLFDLIEQ